MLTNVKQVCEKKVVWKNSKVGHLLALCAILGNLFLPTLGQAGTFPGDADEDGVVDFSDFLLVSNNYLTFGDWNDGDFDGNGFIDDSDVELLVYFYGGSATEWEPSTIDVISSQNIAVRTDGVGLIGNHAYVELELLNGQSPGNCKIAFVSYDGEKSIMLDCTVNAAGEVTYDYHVATISTLYQQEALNLSQSSGSAAPAGNWGLFWRDYVTFLANPAAMDPDLHVYHQVAVVAGVGAVAGLSGCYVLGYNPTLWGGAATLTFGTTHAAPHLVGTGLTAAQVESAIAAHVATQGPNVGHYWGWVQVNGTWIQYRLHVLPNNVFNIGTYIPVSGPLTNH